MEHSKLPWNVLAGWLIVNGDGRSIASTNENDAEFIVEACNNYEALQERCKYLEETLRDTLTKLQSIRVNESADYSLATKRLLINNIKDLLHT